MPNLVLIGGLQKTTLIDFPGRVACTVFTVGCNFRCPFCHNRDLVTLDNFKKTKLEQISEDYFFQFLKKRKKILDGVCITGGEPTMQKDLPEFCKKIKDLGLEVKVDTNGSNPEMLKRLIDGKAVDFIAMDVKTTFESYSKVVKLQNSKTPKLKATIKNSKLIDKIKQSIKIIIQSGLEYEFRTTVVPGLHNKKIMIKLAKDLKKAMQPCSHAAMQPFDFILQRFRPQNCLDPKYLKLKPHDSKQLRDILRVVRKVLPNTELRNVD